MYHNSKTSVNARSKSYLEIHISCKPFDHYGNPKDALLISDISTSLFKTVSCFNDKLIFPSRNNHLPSLSLLPWILNSWKLRPLFSTNFLTTSVYLFLGKPFPSTLSTSPLYILLVNHAQYLYVQTIFECSGTSKLFLLPHLFFLLLQFLIPSMRPTRNSLWKLHREQFHFINP